MPERHRLSRCAAVALLAIVRVCAAQDGAADPQAAPEKPSDIDALLATHDVARMQEQEASGLARAESRFGMELLRQIETSDPTANRLVAPYGAFTVLNLAAEGASPDFRQQLAAVLHVEALERPLLQRALQVQRASLANRDGTQIDVACAVWLAGNLPLSADFAAVAHDGYGASASKVHFSSPDAATTINRWASDSTHGAIPSAVSSVPASTLMVLATVTAFKASWLQHFDEDKTAPHAFTDAAGHVGEATMMHCRDDVPFVQDKNLGAKIVCLRCAAFAKDEESGCHFYAVLPDKGGSLSAVLDRLAAEPLRDRFSRLERQSVEIMLPRFRFTCELQLADTLAQMGLQGASKGAVFTGISPGTALRLSEMRETNTIAVDENGVAATSADLLLLHGAEEQTSDASFIADRPFLYFIFDDATGLLLFAGVLATPS